MDEMFEKYSPMIFRYLKGLCGDDSLAEELMQETFYQAVKSINRYDGTCKPSTWLCQIAKHMWLRELKRQKRVSDIQPDESMFPFDDRGDYPGYYYSDIEKDSPFTDEDIVVIHFKDKSVEYHLKDIAEKEGIQ